MIDEQDKDVHDEHTARGHVGFSILDSKLFAAPMQTPGLDLAKAPGLILFRETHETEADFIGRAKRMVAELGYRTMWVSGFYNVTPAKE